MKLQEYRNSEVRAQLDRAAKIWLIDNPKRSFQEPKAISISQILKWFLVSCLLSLIPLVLWISKEDGPLLLAVALPILALIAFLKMARIQAAPSAKEAIHLLPFDDQTLTRQVRRDLRRPLIEGLIISALLGVFGADVVFSLTGALQSLLIFIGLLGCLMISYYWRFFEVFTLLAKVCAGLLFAGMVIDRLKGLNRGLLEATPWFQAFDSPLILGGLLASGATVAWFTKDRWSKITRFNRTAFYQNSGSHQVEASSEKGDTETTIASSDFPPPPTQPRGPLERLVWRFLTIKEKGLLRSIGGNSTNYLSAWIKTTSAFLLVLWLTRFNWPPFIESMRSAAPILTLGFMAITTGLCSSPLTRYLHGITIGPQTTAPRFQVLPLTLNALEKLMWKVNLPRCILIALTITFASLMQSYSEASIVNFAVTLLVFKTLILHIFWIHFWACSISGWPSRQGRVRVWVSFIQILLFLGIIATFISSMFFLTIFQELSGSWTAGKFGLILTIVIVYHFILRFLVRTLVSDPQSDIIGQT